MQTRLFVPLPCQPLSPLAPNRYPLALGFSHTTHKAQGLTLRRQITDAPGTGGSAFCHGQTYVAASRVRGSKFLRFFVDPALDLCPKTGRVAVENMVLQSFVTGGRISLYMWGTEMQEAMAWDKKARESLKARYGSGEQPDGNPRRMERKYYDPNNEEAVQQSLDNISPEDFAFGQSTETDKNHPVRLLADTIAKTIDAAAEVHELRVAERQWWAEVGGKASASSSTSSPSGVVSTSRAQQFTYASMGEIDIAIAEMDWERGCEGGQPLTASEVLNLRKKLGGHLGGMKGMKGAGSGVLGKAQGILGAPYGVFGAQH